MTNINSLVYQIPFNKPTFVGNELKYIQEALSHGHISGDGIFITKCNALFELELGVKKSFLTPSCTRVLEMVAILLNIQPGDEVIIHSFTFVSTVNAFIIRGAKPVFSDIREYTLNIDENLLENLITNRTKAIIIVHNAGVGCEMDAIMDIAGKYSIPGC